MNFSNNYGGGGQSMGGSGQSNLAKFSMSFKNIWADNGDMLSYHYCGTGSTTSDVTRNG